MVDHDRLFKELFSTFFLEFLDLFLPGVRAYVAAGSVVFVDKEIFVDVTSGERLEPDLVARVRFKGQPACFIIHVETQHQSQRSFGRRLFRYFARLHDKYDLPVYPIAVFPFSSPRKAQSGAYRVEFPNKVVMDFRFDVIQLNRLSWREFVNRPNPVAAALMTKMNIAPGERARVKLECLRLLVTLKLNRAKIKLISGFIDTYLQLNDEEQLEFNQSVKELGIEETEGVMEIVTSWMEQGLRQGRTEGRQEGLIEGARDAVIDILEARFNKVPARLRRTLKSVDDGKQLRVLLRKAATAATLKEFEMNL